MYLNRLFSTKIITHRTSDEQVINKWQQDKKTQTNFYYKKRRKTPKSLSDPHNKNSNRRDWEEQIIFPILSFN